MPSAGADVSDESLSSKRGSAGSNESLSSKRERNEPLSSAGFEGGEPVPPFVGCHGAISAGVGLLKSLPLEIARWKSMQSVRRWQ